ncbi:FAST kinase domain-containing protein 4 [Daktulosphaira vitifoliae]|uniref:FAST kinase domain-containing protein 4 n=1 Tax=Daktulosphaira vitifoliae TaxID=58002 RepID=UPI0021AAD865|nr:FAST kinase domain-containing protein 4 [Daktulosphaira vitifoliae]XP_050545800.1 FAST kinase domain-containing protein 4 [Daktulosphaira vitifoliae]
MNTMMRWSRTSIHFISALRLQSRSLNTIKPSAEDFKIADKKNNPSNSSIVAAAFASLKEIDSTKSSKKNAYFIVNNKLDNAKTTEDLLELANAPVLSKSQALKAVSILAEWASTGRAKLTEFEADSRFLKLCKLLGKENLKKDYLFNDLSTVLSITGDDEAAKLISTISLPQMIRVLSALAVKKKRSITLMRSLAFNIGRSSEKLDIKQCADVLYALAILNFPDEVLMEKVSSDVCSLLPSNDRSSVIGSIITSMGVLRLRDTDLLESLSTWLEKNIDNCKKHTLESFIITLAYVNYKPINFESISKVFENNKKIDVSNINTWLDVVWSLIVLEKENNEHLESVLSPDFTANLLKLKDNQIVPIKLLNINGYAKTKSQYKGPLLNLNLEDYQVKLTKSKDKQALMASMMDALSSILPSINIIKTDVCTNFGFIIDAVCAFDSKLNPIPLNSNESTNTEIHKIAFMLTGFHDSCRGCHNEPNGIVVLNTRLIKSLGYKVLTVPYTEFGIRDSLVNRIKYLKENIQLLIKESQ